jgi:hypothetical protein
VGTAAIGSSAKNEVDDQWKGTSDIYISIYISIEFYHIISIL